MITGKENYLGFFLSLLKDKEFAGLIEDRISGSTSLLISFINMALAKLREKKWDAQQFREYLDKFSESFIDMETIQVFARVIETSHDDKIISLLESQLGSIDKKIQIIFNSFLAIIEREYKGQELQLLTISNSSMIYSIFSKLHKETKISFMVNVLESLPGGEGKKLYEDLLVNGVKAILIPDNLFYGKSDHDNFDLFISGCDAYTENGFINKIGTNKLIDLSLDIGIQLLVLTDKSKKAKYLSKNPDSELLEYCARKSNVVYLDGSSNLL